MFNLLGFDFVDNILYFHQRVLPVGDHLNCACMLKNCVCNKREGAAVIQWAPKYDTDIIIIYIYIYMCMCVCVGGWVGGCDCSFVSLFVLFCIYRRSTSTDDRAYGYRA